MGLTHFPNGITAWGIPVLPLGIMDAQNVYFVDAQDGNDGNLGNNWDQAFATWARAIAVSNATIDWSATPKRNNVIFGAPGVYAESLASFPYYCWMIGTGVQGTDTAAEIHPTTGSCMAGTMLGTRILNIWFETNEAVDCLDAGICNNSEVAYCTFTNGAAVAAKALSTDNCTHLHFHHNSVESGQLTGMDFGLYFQGGADKFAHNVRIYENEFHCTTSGVWIENNCTATGARIYNNRIFCSGGASIGIDDNNGNSYCTGNWISANDAIQHANSVTHCVGNSVSNAGTGAKETTGS